MCSINHNFRSNLKKKLNLWCLKWHMRFNLKKTKFMAIPRSRTIAPGYGDLTLGSVELQEVKSLLFDLQKEGQCLGLLFKIYHRVGHPMNGYRNHFVAGRNILASTVLGKLALGTPYCRTDQLCRFICGTGCRRACLVVAP